MERLQKEDWDNLLKKKEAQKNLMEEVTKCNHVSIEIREENVSMSVCVCPLMMCLGV